MKTKFFLTVSAGVCMFILSSSQVVAQDLVTKLKTEISTQANKLKIEKGLSAIKGVKSVNADVASKLVTTKYNATQTNAKSISDALTKLGFKNEIVAQAQEKISKAKGMIK